MDSIGGIITGNGGKTGRVTLGQAGKCLRHASMIGRLTTANAIGTLDITLCKPIGGNIGRNSDQQRHIGQQPHAADAMQGQDIRIGQTPPPP